MSPSDSEGEKNNGNNLLDSPNKKGVNYNRCALFKVPSLEEIREARRKKIIIRMLSVYADESTDEKKERVFAVAGVMGTQEEWDELESKWLERTNGIPFHATDCEPGWGVYKDIPKKERLSLYKDLTILLADSKMLGYGTVIDLKAYHEVFGRDSSEAPYIFCFVQTVGNFVREARRVIPQEEVEFTFDINDEMQFNAAFLYNNYLTKHPEYKVALPYMGKKVSFATKDTVGIQVADLFVHETMKYFDNFLSSDPDRRQTRLSLQRLKNTGRFKIECNTKADLESLREHYGEQRIAKENKEYEQWRLANNCSNNLESKLRYLIHLDNIKKLRGEKA